MSLLAVVNPSKRRRRRKSAARRHGRRKMTAKQLMYFGPRRKRRVRRSRTYSMNMAPNPRRRRSYGKRRAMRRYRRNPVGAPRFRMGYITSAVQDAAVGAGGALVTDLAMAQAARALPATMTSRFSADGSPNFGYYGVKLALAIGLGLLGTQFLPGRFRKFAATGTAGALTVSAYELSRSMLPADLVLGYMTPGRNAGMARYGRMGAYLKRPGMGAYLPTGAVTPSGAMAYGANETRIGEGTIQ